MKICQLICSDTMSSSFNLTRLLSPTADPAPAKPNREADQATSFSRGAAETSRVCSRKVRLPKAPDTVSVLGTFLHLLFPKTSPLDSLLCDALDLPSEDKGLGIDQVVPLPIVAGGPALQHNETDQGLPGDALQGDAGRGSQPLSAAAAQMEMPLSLYVLGCI